MNTPTPPVSSGSIPEILVHVDAGVMTITLNRVDKKNSITSAMYGALADALESANHDAAVRAVVIQGHETIFSAGNDIADFLNNPPATSDSPVFRFPARHQQLSQAPGRGCVRPGRGHRHHAAAALRPGLCRRQRGVLDAFRQPGPVPGSRVKLLVPQLMGYPRAAEALLLGEPFMAETALEIGLINRIVPPAEANALAQRQAQKLVAKPLSALMETKRLMKKGNATVVAERMAEEGASFGRMLGEPAAREAFSAFMEKRKPDFSAV
jgi:enoyl-CoA hydratase/carnithine racemase